MPPKQPKRGRLWLNDGSCVRLRPERPNHVWAYDFVEDRTRDGRRFRMLNVVDEFTRECLAIDVAGSIRSARVIDVLRQVTTSTTSGCFRRTEFAEINLEKRMLQAAYAVAALTKLNQIGREYVLRDRRSR